MGEAADLAATAHAFNKILSQPKLSSKSRTPDDVEESIKKLRRLILIEGIPSKAVSASAHWRWRWSPRCVSHPPMRSFAGSDAAI
jgi:cell cycle arrest protein BUB2